MRPLLPLFKVVTAIAAVLILLTRNTTIDEGFKVFFEKTFINWNKGGLH
ncbi:hypothetical protein PAEVO_63960 [Paenibacillus sp. GM2FR]|nr:hypothetical protein PAEVO_63960 [Paenibacillus sp. GM2FR]